MEKINTTMLTKTLAEKTGITNKQAHAVITELASTINEQVAAGNSVYIKDLGTFTSRKHAERSYHDMHAKAMKTLPAHTTPVFRASTCLKASAAKIKA